MFLDSFVLLVSIFLTSNWNYLGSRRRAKPEDDDNEGSDVEDGNSQGSKSDEDEEEEDNSEEENSEEDNSEEEEQDEEQSADLDQAEDGNDDIEVEGEKEEEQEEEKAEKEEKKDKKEQKESKGNKKTKAGRKQAIKQTLETNPNHKELQNVCAHKGHWFIVVWIFYHLKAVNSKWSWTHSNTSNYTKSNVSCVQPAQPALKSLTRTH